MTGTYWHSGTVTCDTTSATCVYSTVGYRTRVSDTTSIVFDPPVTSGGYSIRVSENTSIVYDTEGIDAAYLYYGRTIPLYSNVGYVFTPESPAEKADREKREAEQRAAREAAEKKAEALLLKVAGEEAFRLFKEKGYIDVSGKSGQKYRLRVNQKVDVLDGEKVSHRLCAVLADWSIPRVDELVTKLLFLTAAEEDFKKVAIKHAA